MRGGSEGSRVHRAAQGLRRAYALGRLGLTTSRARRRPQTGASSTDTRAIVAQLGDLRGLPQKIGQLLSLLQLDAAPSCYESLTEAGPPAPASEAFEWIERELGCPLSTVFRRLDERGAAASIGQVHRGELLDGQTVAVKVQYPHVASGVDLDLAALKWLAAPLTAGRSGYGLQAYRRELRRVLLEELDYEREASVLRRFAGRVRDIPGLVSPVPIDPLCTRRLITMTWVDGEPFRTTASWSSGEKCEAALALLRFFLRGVLDWGELHADPHPGNLRFARTRGEVRVGVVDFGCVHALRHAEQAAFWRLATEGATLAEPDLLSAFASAGFDAQLLEPIAHRLPLVTRILFEPFHATAPYDVRAWCLGERLAVALGDDRWSFRFAAPPSLVFFIRALMGVVQYVTRLEARLDWRGELLSHHAPEVPGDEETTRPPVARASVGGSRRTDMMATALKLSVTNDGKDVVKLTLAPEVAERLGDLVPDDLRGVLAERRIDVDAIAQRAVAGGYLPGELFTFDDGAKTVRVWLE